MTDFIQGKRYYSIPHHSYVYFERCRFMYNGKPCCDYIFRDICDAIIIFTAEEVARCIIEK